MPNARKKYAVLMMMTAWLLLFSGICATLADAADVVGRFTAVEGKVDVLKGGELPGVAAHVGDSVAVKDIIRTKSDSKAEIVFNDKNVLRMAQRSRVDISEYISETKGVIKLPRGKVEAVVQKKVAGVSVDAHRFEIQTPNAVAGVRGTDFFVTHNNNVSGVIVKEGVVATFNPKFPNVVVNVTAGTSTTITTAKPPLPPKPISASEVTTHEKDTTPAPKPKDSGKSGSNSNGSSDSGNGSGASGTGTSSGSASGTGNASGTKSGTTSNAKDSGSSSGSTSGATSGTANTDSSSGTTTTDTGGTTATTTSTTSSGTSATGVTGSTTTADSGSTGSTGSTGTADLSRSLTTSSSGTSTTGTTGTTTTTDTTGTVYAYTPPPTTLTTTTTMSTTTTTTASTLPPITETFTVAAPLQPPTLTITSAPTAFTNSNRALFTFSSSAPVTLTLNGAPVTAVDLAAMTLGAGTQTLVATATDATNNLSTAVTYTWTTDYTPPVVTVSNLPAAISNAASPSIGVVSTDSSPVTNTYILDGVAVASPNLANLGDGSHTFTITATDAAGNSASQTYTWSVDTTPPVVTLSGTPAAVTNVNSAPIIATATDANTLTYSYVVDNGAPSATPPLLTNLSEGGHTYTVTATDAAGNSSTKTYSWTTDYTAPVVTLFGTPAAITNVNSAPIIAAATDANAVTYSYVVDNGAPSATPPLLTNLSEGGHTYTVIATDAAGNSSTKTYSWTTDYTAPVLALSGVSPRLVSGSSTASFTGVITDANPENVYASVDSGAWQAFSNGNLALSNIGEGMHHASFYAYDLAGNLSNSESYDWFVGNRQYFTAGLSQGGLYGHVDATSEGIRALSSGNIGAWLIDMSGTHGYGAAMPAALNVVTGGTAYAGVDATAPFDGYWLSYVTANAANGALTGASNFNYLSTTVLGSGLGSVSGTYDAASWQMTDYGLAYDVSGVVQPQYVETPLQFASSVQGDRYFSVKHNYANYANGAGGSFYSDYAVIPGVYNTYRSIGSTSAYYYVWPVSTSTYNYYYADGSANTQFYGYNYSTGISTYTNTPLTWDTTLPISSVVSVLPDTNYVLTYSGAYADYWYNGSFDALFGGTGSLVSGAKGSLWSASAVDPAAVVMIGSYNTQGALLSNLWTSYNVDSFNYINQTNTTYDGGAYRGFFAAVDVNGAMDGRFVGLYVDPSGNTGYLKGALNGANYPAIGMFYMNGGVSAVQMAQATGLSQPNFINNNIWWDGSGFTIDGAFSNGGMIGDRQNWNGYIDTLAVMDYPNKIASENWGVYMLKTYGEYQNPGNSSSWHAKLGGDGRFGAYSLTDRVYGNYNYADGGSYSYYYNTNINYSYYVASVNYYRPGASTYYFVNYYSDGTTYTYNYWTGTWSYGTWDMTAPFSNFASPVDAAYSFSSGGQYVTGNSDRGYWLADVNNGQWANGKLTGDLSGRFITYTKLGTISGDALGAYNADGTFSLASLGVWSGTPLTFMSDFSFRGYSTDMYTSGGYSYADGGYYDYNYTGSHDGYVRYYRPGGSNYYVYYYSDGSTYTHDYNTGISVNGRWNTAQTLASVLETPIDGINATFTGSYSYPDYFTNGWAYTILGGTGDLWHATQASPASATMIGEFYQDTHTPMVFANVLSSNNYVNNTNTTYDNGAYYGYLAGTGVNNSLKMALAALYIDPSGNAGVLKGSLTGTAYPGSDVFAMDGGIYPVQMAANVGILPADLYNSVYRGRGYGQTMGTFGNGGAVASYPWGWYQGDLRTMSIFDYNTGLAQNWGVYAYTDYGQYTNAASSWSAKAGGTGTFGQYSGIWGVYSNDGYWLADITGGQWANNAVSGALSGAYITDRYLGAITGNVYGTYNNGTWQYASIGTWSQTPLTFVSRLMPSGISVYKTTDIWYSYGDGGYYNVYSNGYNAARARYYRPGLTNSYTYYYSGGSTYTYDYNTWSSSYGAWTPTNDLVSTFATPPDSANATLNYISNSMDYFYNVWTDAIMGGTGDLWHATQTAPAGVTLIGRYWQSYDVPVMFSDYFYSHNYVNYTDTTYDNGAYYGFYVGTGVNNNLKMGLAALYIDPSGNAGVLKGALTGTAYPDISLFGMNGSMYPTQMAANIGTSPADLSRSIWQAYGYGRTIGSFNGAGRIYSISSWYQGGLTTMSIVDYNTSLAQNWGVYSYTDTGMFTNKPSAASAWSAKLGGNATFGAFNVGREFYGAYQYADGGSYSYTYYTPDTGMSATANYYRPGGANYYVRYYTDGTKYKYDYNTGVSTSGVWDTTLGVAAFAAVAPDQSYASSTSNNFWLTNSNFGYWIADIGNGQWANNAISGTFGGRYITKRYLGTISGDVLGTYNADGTWQYASVGTWQNETPLTFMSYMYPVGHSTSRYNTANYTYSDGGYYNFNNTGNNGYVWYYRPGVAHYYTGYNGDGTTYTYNYMTYTNSYGTWDTAQGLYSVIGTPLDAANATLGSSDSYARTYNNVWTDAIMGGTGDLWHATQAAPALVTMIGDYSQSYNVPVVFYDSFSSHNSISHTGITYDNGAYYGCYAGTGINNNLKMGLIALYIDPNGNAGYLKGSLTGTAYPDGNVFVMDGGMYPTQVVANIGTSAADLSNSTWWAYGYGRTLGAFGGAGSITSETHNNWYQGDMQTMSIVDYNTNLAQGWGIYRYADVGNFTNPSGASAWSAKLGGDSTFGYYNPSKHYYGNYGYADTGSYYYSYDTYGTAFVRYYRPGVAYYYTNYYANGTTYTYNYITWSSSYGTWDTTQSLLTLASTAPDAVYASSSSGFYWNTNSNYGYWIADITNGQWAGNGISGKLNGRYITERYLGTISGDVYGTYDADGTWQYVSLGTWQNTAPLSHVALLSPSTYNTARHIAAYYTYADGGSYGSYVDTGSGSYSYVRYYRPGGANYVAFYYKDGTSDTLDYNTWVWTSGTWDKTLSLDALKALLLTPVDQANATPSGSSDYAYQQFGGSMYGYLGGVDSLWGTSIASPAAITAIGEHNNGNFAANAPFTFTQAISSYNYANYTNTTYDNGAYKGYIIGASSSANAMSSRLVALYIDPAGNAGILRGSLGGSYYPGIGVFAMDGSAYATQMAANIGIAPANLYGNVLNGLDYVREYGSFGGTGSIYGSNAASLEYMSIGNSPWGVYRMTDYGLYSAASPAAGSAFSLTAGGSGGAYKLHYITGTFNADLTITGTQTGRFIDLYTLGVLQGDALGTYNPFDGTWQIASAGAWTETPLAWSGNVYNDSNWASLYSYVDYGGYGWLETQGYGNGFMGDITSLGIGTGFTMMGSYHANASGTPYIWAPETFVNFATASTGVYNGFIGGVWKDGAINGKVYSLYIDPAGNAGILTGPVTGAYYPALNMFEADGSWTPTVLATGLDATTVGIRYLMAANYGYGITSSPESGFNGFGSIVAAGNEMLSVTDWRNSVNGQDWGIWKSLIGGTYTGPAVDTACAVAGSCDTWSLDTVVGVWNSSSGTQTIGTKWSDGVLAGQTTGFGADITNTPQTWITVGETIGIFDPAKATFAAIQLGVYMETNKLLTLASTTQGQDVLKKLNIPAVEVGRTNLSGSWTNGADSMTANMNNVVFLAPVTGAAPAIWGSNAVSGTFAGNPVAANVAMSNAAANINANFAVKTWDATNNKWLSTVNGSANAGALSGYAGAVNFKGAGAGTINPGAGTFSGTAAGVAK